MEIDVIIRKALLAQSILIDFDEHIGIPAAIQAQLGVRDGMQLRVSRPGIALQGYGDIALTVRTIDGVDVRMGKTARDKIGGGSDFTVRLSSNVVHNHLSDEEAIHASDLVERICLGGSRLIVLAPHGGDIEVNTNHQAMRLFARAAPRGASYWMTLGFDTAKYPRPMNAHSRWHITSADMSAASFPYLGMALSQRYKYAVAFHGHAEDYILVGGLAPDTLRSQVVARLQSLLPGVAVRLAERNAENSGSGRQNMVNVATESGSGSIQLECPRDVRLNQWPTVADAVADLIERWA